MQRYGGIMLIKPLIEEFGVPRTLAYIAQTPFRVEDNNLREAAVHYQERARESLSFAMQVSRRWPLRRLEIRSCRSSPAHTRSSRAPRRSRAAVPSRLRVL